MVRALRAFDGGDLDAMAPVRVPSIEEENAKRLLRRRERLVKERTRITNTIGGLLRLHGISGEAPRKPGFRERVDTLKTGCGGPGSGRGDGEARWRWCEPSDAGRAAAELRHPRGPQGGEGRD